MTPSTPATSPAREAAAAVLETVPLVMRAIRTRMREGRPEAISIPQFRALIFIRRHPGTDLSAVANQVGTSLAAASELVARLVRQGLVVRETDPGSRRRIRLTLSDVGLADLEAAELRTTAWLVDLVARLDADRTRTLVTALADLRSLVHGALAEDAAPDERRAASPELPTTWSRGSRVRSAQRRPPRRAERPAGGAGPVSRPCCQPPSAPGAPRSRRPRHRRCPAGARPSGAMAPRAT